MHLSKVLNWGVAGSLKTCCVYWIPQSINTLA
jgi:hypothetical protein